MKYLFTATKLSIQVHPDGEAARRAGLPHGKDEAWYILAAEEGAVIGIGLQRSMSKDQLRASALDGSIEQMLDWRPVRAGDVLYAPAGTVHAIGAGISLIEVQQNLDVTYRLFDYGRDRPLQLDEALAVADPRPLPHAPEPHAISDWRSLLCAGESFRLERWAGPHEAGLRLSGGAAWLVPLGAGLVVDGQSIEAGSVAVIEHAAAIELADNAQALVAYASGTDLHVD
ncbi:MAG: class I mannose-6-phosphate isomerase [Sphingomicrobium sp.]